MAKKSKPPHKFSSSGSQPPLPQEKYGSSSVNLAAREPSSLKPQLEQVVSSDSTPIPPAISKCPVEESSSLEAAAASRTGNTVFPHSCQIQSSASQQLAPTLEQPKPTSWCEVVNPTNKRMTRKGEASLLESGELCVTIPNEVITRNLHRWDNFILAQFHGKAPSPGKWVPGMTPAIPELTFAPVWVDFRGVPHQFFSEEGLEHVAGLVGDPGCAHPNTLNMTNLEVARVLTIIDPSKPLPEFINLRFQSGEVCRVGVSSPWLPPLCDHCKEIGHSIRSCPLAPILCSGCNSKSHSAGKCPRAKKGGPKAVDVEQNSKMVKLKAKVADMPTTPVKVRRKKLRKQLTLEFPAFSYADKVKGASLGVVIGDRVGSSKQPRRALSDKSSESEPEPLSTDPSADPSSSEDFSASEEDDNPQVDARFLKALSKKKEKQRHEESFPVEVNRSEK
ncbi:hypothetical protein AALP_AAs44455U000100, partial [Arabis alpina]